MASTHFLISASHLRFSWPAQSNRTSITFTDNSLSAFYCGPYLKGIALKADIEHLFGPQECPPDTCPLPTDFQTVTDTHYGHGRFETRTLTSSSMLKDFLDWPYLEQVFKLDYHAVDLKTGQVYTDTHYGLTSLSAAEATPQHLLTLKRHYWGIENRLHYRRDVCLNEDRCRLRTGHAAQTIAIINNLVLALIDRLDSKSIPDARRIFSAHPIQALNLFFQSPIPTLQ